jgi:hypothetical protein
MAKKKLLNPKQRQNRMKLFHTAIFGYSKKNELEEAKKHDRGFVVAVLKLVTESPDNEDAQNLLDLDPQFTSSSQGEAAQLVSREMLETPIFSGHYIDLEIVGKNFALHFDNSAGAIRDAILKKLENYGKAELVAQPFERLFQGVASNVFTFLLEPDPEAIQSEFEKRKNNSLDSANEGKIIPENSTGEFSAMKDLSLQECEQLGLNPSVFSDESLEECEVTVTEIAEIHETVYGKNSTSSYRGMNGLEARNGMIRSLGFSQVLTNENELPAGATDLDVQVATFNKKFFESLREDYSLSEDEDLSLDEAELEVLVEEYMEAFLLEFADLTDEELSGLTFGHTVNPRQEDFEEQKSDMIEALAVASEVEDELIDEEDIDEEGLEEAFKKITKKGGKGKGSLWHKAKIASKFPTLKKKGERARRLAKKRAKVVKENFNNEEAVMFLLEKSAATIRKSMQRAMAVKGFLSNNHYNPNPKKGGGASKGGGRYPGIKKWLKFTKKKRAIKSKKMKK